MSEGSLDTVRTRGRSEQIILSLNCFLFPLDVSRFLLERHFPVIHLELWKSAWRAPSGIFGAWNAGREMSSCNCKNNEQALLSVSDISQLITIEEDVCTSIKQGFCSNQTICSFFFFSFCFFTCMSEPGISTVSLFSHLSQSLPQYNTWETWGCSSLEHLS